MADDIPGVPAVYEKFWSVVRPFFTGMFEATWAGFVELVPPVLDKIADRLSLPAYSAEAEVWRGMLLNYVDLGMLDRDSIDDLVKCKDFTTPWDKVMFFMIWLGLWKAWAGTIMFAASGTLRKNLAAKHTPEVPRPGEIIRAAFIAPEKTGEVRHAMKQFGLSDKDQDLMFLASYQTYNEEVVKDLFLRGVLSEDEMFMRMRELGFTDTRIKEIIQSWVVVPNIPDLIMMLAKEAFEPDMVKLLGLDAEFPEEMVTWAQKHGLTREWCQKFWFAHWDVPAIQQGFEMLHRGVIDEELLDVLYRAAEVPPLWRKKYTAISYNPYTRVDVRRMHKTGTIGDEELKKAYTDVGYDDAHAQKMMEFTIQYNKGADKEITKGQVLRAYRAKLIQRHEAYDMLLQLDFPEDIAEYTLALDDWMEALDAQDDVIDVVKMLYQENLIDDNEARRRLYELDLPAVKVDTTMEKWKLRRFKDRKLPSKADLDKFLKTRIISELEYFDEMERLGYGRKYSEWYFRLSKMKKAG